jgi:hypothetical protein
MDAIHRGDYLGRRLLILGDVNTGKTTLARTILDDLCRRGLGARIAIVDLAPWIPESLAREKGLVGVGGNLRAPQGSGALYVADHLDPPRLSSATEAEAMEKARLNCRAIERLFQRLDTDPREILFVNDVTMYLHAGTAEAMIARFGRANTVIVNGYRGERLGAGELTRRERTETEKLMTWFETAGTVLALSPPTIDAGNARAGVAGPR